MMSCRSRSQSFACARPMQRTPVCIKISTLELKRVMCSVLCTSMQKEQLCIFTPLYSSAENSCVYLFFCATLQRTAAYMTCFYISAENSCTCSSFVHQCEEQLWSIHCSFRSVQRTDWLVGYWFLTPSQLYRSYQSESVQRTAVYITSVQRTVVHITSVQRTAVYIASGKRTVVHITSVQKNNCVHYNRAKNSFRYRYYISAKNGCAHYISAKNSCIHCDISAKNSCGHYTSHCKEQLWRLQQCNEQLCILHQCKEHL